MVAKLLLLVAAACALHVASCNVISAPRPRRDAPAPTAGPLEQLQKNADEFSKAFSEQINSLVNSKNTQELNKVLKESSDTILQQVSALSNSLQGVLSDADGKAKDALVKARTELEKTSTDLKKKHPEVERQATELRERLQGAVQATLQHSQVLAKEVGSGLQQTGDKLAPRIKAAYDDFLKQAQEVQRKLQEAAAVKQ